MAFLYTIASRTGTFNALCLVPRDQGFTEGLPPQAIIGTLPVDTSKVSQEKFTPNKAFIDFLHRIVERYVPLNSEFQKAARRQIEGWLYIIDRRVPNQQGHIEAEDVIGAFKIESGALVPGSYRRNTKHLLVSSRGLFCLDDWLQRKLLEEIRSLGSTEADLTSLSPN